MAPKLRDLPGVKYAPSEPIKIQPNDRLAVVGKTGSGKTNFSTTLATMLVAAVNKQLLAQSEDADLWQVWWVDTKGDPKDIKRLRDWGYVRVKSLLNGKPDGPELYRYFKLERPNDDENCCRQVDAIAKAAYAHGKVLLVVDEWVQAIVSSRRLPGGLLDIEQRGRGKQTGLLGQTQEPVDIPRQLISQASHLFIFELTFLRDIDYMRQFCPQYRKPRDMGGDSTAHGFWYRHIDGGHEWIFFRHEREFYDWVKGHGN